MKAFKLFVDRMRNPKIKAQLQPDGSMKYIIPVGKISKEQAEKNIADLMQMYKETIPGNVIPLDGWFLPNKLEDGEENI